MAAPAPRSCTSATWRSTPLAASCDGAGGVDLTPRQFALLDFLMRHVDEVVSKSEILAGVWDHAFEGDPNIVEVYVRRLRSRIDEPFARHTIHTVRGAGYRLSNPAHEES